MQRKAQGTIQLEGSETVDARHMPPFEGTLAPRAPSRRPAGSLVPDRVTQLPKPFREEPPLRLLARQLQGPPIGGPSLRCPSQPPAEVRPRRVGQVVPPKVAPVQDRVHEGKPRPRTVSHGHGRGPVQLHHGGRLRSQEDVVEPDDLGLVRVGGSQGTGVHGGDRRLEGVRAETA